MSVTVRQLAVALLAAGLVASLVVVGTPTGPGAASQGTQATTTQDAAFLRVVHASPDAPAVDVYVDDEPVLEDVPFGAVSDYLQVAPGTHSVTITAADDPDAVVFNGTVTLDRRTATTLAASGEVSHRMEVTEPFEPVAYRDDAFAPGPNESAVSVIHLSPGAPAVDVTVDNGSAVLAENVSYQNASDYVTVQAGNYTVEIRAATETNDGPVVATVNVTLEGGTAYSAMAVGYLNPDEAPADTPFQVLLTEDATTTITLPGTGTPTPTETETETNATETPTPTP